MKIILFVCLLLISLNANALDRDKQLHLGASTMLGSASYIVFKDDTTKALASCLSIGLAKELYDEYDYGGFDSKDMVANAIGCGIGYSVSHGIDVLFFDNTIHLHYNF